MTAYIAYDDLMSLSDNDHDTTPTALDIDNAFNGQTWNRVSFPFAFDQLYILETDFVSAHTVDYLAFLFHNLWLATNIKIEVKQGMNPTGTW